MDRQFRNERIERDDDDDERKDNTPEIGCLATWAEQRRRVRAADPDVGPPVVTRLGKRPGSFLSWQIGTQK